MSEPLRTACPHCATVFRITDPRQIGRSTLCIRCGRMFVISPRVPVAAPTVDPQPSEAERPASAATMVPLSRAPEPVAGRGAGVPRPAAAPRAAVAPTPAPQATAAGAGHGMVVPVPVRPRNIWRTVQWLLAFAAVTALSTVAVRNWNDKRKRDREEELRSRVVDVFPPPPTASEDPFSVPDPPRPPGATGGTAEEDSLWCRHHLIGLQTAIERYRKEHGDYPLSALRDAAGKPLLSWRVSLLRYMGPDEEKLYAEFALDEPWDGPRNARLLERMPRWYRCPTSTAPLDRATYLAVVGERSVVSPSTLSTRWVDVTDDPDRTLMVVEVQDEFAVPWTKPEDLPYASPKLAEAIGTRHADRFHGLLATGFPESFPAGLPLETLRALCTRDGGETVELPKNGK
jgi:predicted Zn finger-like uncharacterized protein